jgi:hypothetical protein
MILRRLSIATPLLAAAMVALLHPWTAVSARSSLLSPPGSGPGLPVDPDDIVNVAFDQTMAAGQSVTVYTVPAKRSLVVTQVGLVTGSGQSDTQLVERSRQGTEVKLFSQFTSVSSLGIGLAFAPGSSVDVVNTRTTSDRVTLKLFGYVAPSNHWPPVDPSDIFDTTGTTSLARGETFRIFSVPADRWLVITSNAISGSGDFALLEEFAGAQTAKPLNERDSQLVGIAFRPGSSVVLRNDVQFGVTAYRWLLTGYLAK